MSNLLTGRSILVVEDENLIVMMLEGMLAELGCESVSQASSVHQALSMIKAERFDAAMLDLNLHSSKTDAVAHSLSDHGIPFFVATGYADARLAAPHTDIHVLRKPFTRALLEDSFRRILAPTVAA